MEKISVILPIYNVERYLEQCLESLLVQTHTNLEIILVNDGSKDGSLEICRTYAEKDVRIKVIDKVNEGVAIARNTGMAAATGEYIAFIDPDDWVEPEMYDSMLRQIKQQEAPICLCNFYKDTKRRSQPKYFEFDEEVLRDQEIIDELINNMVGMADFLPKYVYVMGSVWRGLFNRHFLECHELKFVPKLTIMEDLVFMVQVLLKCGKVAIDHNVWYHYVQHATSTLHSYNGQLWEDQLVVYQLLEQSLKEAALDSAEMRNRLDIRYLGMVLTAIKNETYTKKDGELRDTLINIKDIFSDETLRCVLERVRPIQVEKAVEKDEKKDKKEKSRRKTVQKVRAQNQAMSLMEEKEESLTKKVVKKSKKLAKATLSGDESVSTEERKKKRRSKKGQSLQEK